MKLFDDYTKQFDFSNEKIELKYHHSYRVQKLCEMIAKNLKMNERDLYLASITGLFHDIARFRQITEYHTFLDSQSFDHGDVGADIFNNEIANQLDLSEEERIIIYKAIKYHNKLAIGNDVNDRELIFCQIVRDADKVDILYLFATNASLPGKTDGEVNSDCHRIFMNKQSISHEYVTNGTEKNVAALASLWDINFPISKQVIKEKKYFQQIEKMLNHEIYNKYFKLIYEDLEVE